MTGSSAYINSITGVNGYFTNFSAGNIIFPTSETITNLTTTTMTGTIIYASTQISTPNLNIGNNPLSTWATINVPSYTSFSDIAWSEQLQMFIATVGYNSQYLYSTNGTIWSICSYGSPYYMGDNNSVMYIPELSLWAISSENYVFLTSS